MIIQLVLQGRYSKDGEPFTHMNVRRIVPVAIDIKDELKDVKKFFCKDENRDVWGLEDDEGMFWRIVEAFEVMEPELFIHGNKYPVSFELTDDGFEETIKEYKDGKNSID